MKNICDALRNFLPFAQFKKREHSWRSGGVLLLLKLQACKETQLQRRFSRFLNCRNGTKSRKTSHIIDTSRVYYSKY